MKIGKIISANYLQKLVIFAGLLVFACVFDHFHHKNEQDKNSVEQHKEEESKEEPSFVCYFFSTPSYFSLKILTQKDVSKNPALYNKLLKITTHNNTHAYHALKTEMLNFFPDILQRNLRVINYYCSALSDDIPLFS